MRWDRIPLLLAATGALIVGAIRLPSTAEGGAVLVAAGLIGWGAFIALQARDHRHQDQPEDGPDD